jgi:general secretion pathway protein G
MLKRLNVRLEKARSEEGFTLIELLLVIVILGVLAGIVVFSVSGINDQSKSAACKADVSTTQTAVEAYYAQNTAYPATLAAIAPPTAVKPLLKSVPTDVAYDSATGNVTAAC